MKIKIYLIAIFFFAGIYAGQAQEWGYIHSFTNERAINKATDSTPRWGYDNVFEKESINKVYTQGLDTVYVVGYNLIAMSIDRGNTWKKQYIVPELNNPMIFKPDLKDIVFCDKNNGFVILDDGDFILKTTDGGITWEKIELNRYFALTAIACTDLNNIWVVGFGTILHSIDAGETWESIVLEANQVNGVYNSIVFKDTIGYIAGYKDDEAAVLYKTEDKGQTWVKQLTDNNYRSSNFYSLCLTANHAYMCYSLLPPALYSLYQSEDYQNWHEISLDFSSGSISFLNDTVGYSFHTYPTDLTIEVFKTENGGNNWIPVEIDYGPNDYMNIYTQSRRYNLNHNIQLVNDTIGYTVAGGIFCRMPLPDYDSWVNIEEVKVSETLVSLYNRDTDLLIKSQKLPIVSIQIIDISGKILDTQRYNMVEEYEKTINTSAIPKGLYLIKTILSDNTLCTIKWTKQ